MSPHDVLEVLSVLAMLIMGGAVVILARTIERMACRRFDEIDAEIEELQGQMAVLTRDQWEDA
jgi:hypothetical protein